MRIVKDRVLFKLGKPVWRNINNQTRRVVRVQVREKVSDVVYDQARDQVRVQVRHVIASRVNQNAIS